MTRSTPGFGTLGGVFETSVLMQTGKIEHFPIILMGQTYWVEMKAFLEKSLLHEKTINPQDVGLFHFTDDPVKAIEIIKAHQEKQQAMENE